MNIAALLTLISNDVFAEDILPDSEEIAGATSVNSREDANHWLGYAPASVDEINNLEARLDTQLPGSYKEFLLTSNGFKNLSLFLDNLLPAEQVNWAAYTEQSWWFDLMEQDAFNASDEEYFNYDKSQDETKFRGQYFRHALRISDWSDGMCIFLNPLIKSGEEWEVLEYATWYPGTKRYKSFRDFLVRTHEDNVERVKNLI